MNQLQRLTRLLFWSGMVVVSLLAFPSGIPIVVVAWISVACFKARTGHAAWKILLALLLILVVKNPEWSLAMLGLVVALIIALVVETRFDIRRRNSSDTEEGDMQQLSSSWPTWTLVVVIAMVAFVFDSRSSVTRSGSLQSNDEVGPIACLGDSLTDYGYPQALEQLVNNPVLDFGRDGITSAKGLKMLPEILASDPKPAVVVLELGGHDYNQRHSRRSTFENLDAIVEQCQAASVEVLIVEIPRGFIRDPFRGIERQLARKYDLELIPDTLIRKFILFSNICPPGTWMPREKHLSNDGLHPNENGNRLFAETVAASLKKMGAVK